MGSRVIPANRLATLLPKMWEAPAYRGLASAVRLLILDGALPLGARLPSERDLSAALPVSRTTVTAAYARLAAAGLVTSRRGAGHFVAAARAPMTSVLLPAPEPLSNGVIGLTCASPAAPAGLGAAYARAVEQLPALAAGSGYFPEGLPVLREQLAAWFTARGLPTEPAQLVITSGALGALNVVARAVLGRGARALVASPTYPNALSALTGAGARLVDLPLADLGAEAAGLEVLLRRPAPGLAYLIPDFANPTGTLMSAGARARTADLLRRSGTVPVVDETLVELSLEDEPEPLPAPFASFAAGETLTIGSASKAFWGGLRVGWLRVPGPMVDAVIQARATLDLGAAPLEQLVVADLLEHRDLLLPDRRRTLRGRRDHLLAELARSLPHWRVDPPAGGLTLWVQLPEPTARDLTAAAETRGVLVSAGPQFHASSGGERHLRLPFTAPPEVLSDAVRRLALADADVRTGRSRRAFRDLRLSA